MSEGQASATSPQASTARGRSLSMGEFRFGYDSEVDRGSVQPLEEGTLLKVLQKNLKLERSYLTAERGSAGSLEKALVAKTQHLLSDMVKLRQLHVAVDQYREKIVVTEDVDVADFLEETRLVAGKVDMLGSRAKHFERLVLYLTVESPLTFGKVLVDFMLNNDLPPHLFGKHGSVRVVRMITLGLYGQCIGTNEEFYFLQLIQAIIVTLTEKGSSLLDMLQIPFIRYLMVAYWRRCGGSEYLVHILESPLKLLARSIKEENGCNVATLQKVSSAIVASLVTTVQEIPYGIRFVARQIYEIAQKFETKGAAEDDECGNMKVRLFLHTFFIQQAMQDPELYGIYDTAPLDSAMNEDALPELRRVMGALVYNQRFGERDDLHEINGFLDGTQEMLDVFFDTVIQAPSLEDYFDLPEDLPTCVPAGVVTSREEMHILLDLVDIHLGFFAEDPEEAALATPGSSPKNPRPKSTDLIHEELPSDARLRELAEEVKRFPSGTDGYKKEFFFLGARKVDLPTDLAEPDEGNISDDEALAIRVRRLLCDCDIVRPSITPSLLSFLEYERNRMVRMGDLPLAAVIEDTAQSLREVDDPLAVLQYIDDEYHARQRDTTGATMDMRLRTYKEEILGLTTSREKLENNVTAEIDALVQFVENEMLRRFLGHQEEFLGTLVKKMQHCEGLDDKKDAYLSTLCVAKERLKRIIGLSKVNAQRLDDRFEVYLGTLVHQWTFHPHAGSIDRDMDDKLSNKLAEMHGLTPQRFGKNRKGGWNFRECFWRVDWAMAIEELRRLNAVHSPLQKMEVVINCCSIIVNLMRQSEINNLPAGDDFTPILIYVIIKANPPSLSSNTQYLDSFLSSDTKNFCQQVSSLIGVVDFLTNQDLNKEFPVDAEDTVSCENLNKHIRVRMFSSASSSRSNSSRRKGDRNSGSQRLNLSRDSSQTLVTDGTSPHTVRRNSNSSSSSGQVGLLRPASSGTLSVSGMSDGHRNSVVYTNPVLHYQRERLSNISLNDLKWSDIPNLLDDYKTILKQVDADMRSRRGFN